MCVLCNFPVSRQSPCLRWWCLLLIYPFYRPLFCAVLLQNGTLSARIAFFVARRRRGECLFLGFPFVSFHTRPMTHPYHSTPCRRCSEAFGYALRLLSIRVFWLPFRHTFLLFVSLSPPPPLFSLATTIITTTTPREATGVIFFVSLIGSFWRHTVGSSILQSGGSFLIRRRGERR